MRRGQLAVVRRNGGLVCCAADVPVLLYFHVLLKCHKIKERKLDHWCAKPVHIFLLSIQHKCPFFLIESLRVPDLDYWKVRGLPDLNHWKVRGPPDLHHWKVRGPPDLDHWKVRGPLILTLKKSHIWKWTNWIRNAQVVRS